MNREDWSMLVMLICVVVVALIGFMILRSIQAKIQEMPPTVSDDIGQYRVYYAECFKQSEDELMCSMLAAVHAKNN